ncbi:hypothetical protein GGI22_004446 [Coemansia erecta]|nr:hypothetical protein GGI22_004446 [Coemansia erecta]
MSVLVTVGGKHVSNADELDSVMDMYFDSPEEQNYINRFFGCQTWSGKPTPRFRIAYTCRSLLESHEATVCNSHHRPPALCADACNAYIDEWAMLTQNTSMCTNTTTSELRRASLAESCSVWPYNGTNAAGCVSSTESGAEVCGFPVPRSAVEPAFAHDTGRLCGFCKGTKDGCCRGAYVAEKCGQKSAQKRMVFYLALTVSMSAVLVLLITAASVWYMCSARKPRGSLLTCNEEIMDASVVSIKGADSAKGESRDTLRRTTSLIIDSAIREFNGRAMSPAGSSLSGNCCTQPPEGDKIEQSTQSSSTQLFVQQQRCRSSDKQTGFSQITSYLHIGAAYLLQGLGLHRFHSKRHRPSRQACEGINDQQCHPGSESVASARTPSLVACSTEEPHIRVVGGEPTSIGRTFKARSQSLRGHPNQKDHDKHIVASGEMEGDDISSVVSPK